MKHYLAICLLAAGLAVTVTVPASAEPMYVMKDMRTGKCMLMRQLPATPTQRFSMMGLYKNTAQAKRIARRCNRGRL